MVNDSLKDKNNYKVSFYFEYTKNGKSQIEQFRYAQGTIDEDTQKSMLERLVRTFSNEVVDAAGKLNEFDIIKENKSGICYLDEDNKLFNSAYKLIAKLEDSNFEPDQDFTVLGKLNTVKGAIVEVELNESKEKFYLFLKLETFNAFKKGLSKGFFATVKKDGVRKITDDKTVFGIKDKISFYFHNNHFVINNYSNFETMLFLKSEYTKVATKKAHNLKKYKNIFPNIEKLEKDVVSGKGSSVLARMMIRIPLNEINDKFSSKNLNESLKKLDKIINFDDLNNDFPIMKEAIKEGKKFENRTIEYSEENKYEFVSLLSDRPSETILLGKKFIE